MPPLSDATPRPRSRPTRALVTVILIVTIIGGPTAMTTASDHAPADIALYVVTGRTQTEAVPIDPETLADLPDGVPLPVPDDSYADSLLSADGTTLVEILYPDSEDAAAVDTLTVVVRDGPDGPERLRFIPVEPGGALALSRDGSRLVLQTEQQGSPSGVSHPSWHTYDTRTGALHSSVAAEGQGVGPYGFLTAFVDPDARRIYRPFVPGDRAAPGPLTLQIAVNDLLTGAEITRADLTDIAAGAWWEESIEQVPVNGILSPAVTLSPDGTLLAIAHADAERLTLLDAVTLKPVRSVALSRPREVSDRVRDWLGWLSFAPESAAAKVLDGRVLTAVFAPDGHHLYLYGRTGAAGETVDTSVETGLGLRVVAVETGEIVAEALSDALFDQIVLTPDSHDLYVLGPDRSWLNTLGNPTYTLRRLDALTLDTLAARSYSGRLGILLR